MHEPNKAELHAGELKAFEPESQEVFEFGGHTLLLKGTSGPPAARPRMAEGRPIRHEVMIAGQANLLESRGAAGQPVQHRPNPHDAEPGSTGSGQLTGGPVRRS